MKKHIRDPANGMLFSPRHCTSRLPCSLPPALGGTTAVGRRLHLEGMYRAPQLENQGHVRCTEAACKLYEHLLGEVAASFVPNSYILNVQGQPAKSTNIC